MKTIHRLQLPFKLDQLTEGLGNCFPIAIIQQIRRPEISSQLRTAPRRLIKHATGHSQLRQNVHQFMIKSKSPRIVALKSQFEETDGLVTGETWNEYWKRMTTDKTWIDYWFVQATAWYLQLDIFIVATSNTEESPYIEVNGNLADGNKPSLGPVITLGTKSNIHYQSLLPIEMFHLEFRQNQSKSNQSTISIQKQFSEMKKLIERGEQQNYQAKKNMEAPYEIMDACPTEEAINNEAFIYELNNDQLVFQCKTPNYIMKCPRCNVETRYIIRHLSQSTPCKVGIHQEEFKKQFHNYKKRLQDADVVKENQRNRKAISRAKLRAENKELEMKKHREQERKNLINKRIVDHDKVKQQQRVRNKRWVAQKRLEDNENVKQKQRLRNQKWVAEKRQEDYENVKQQQRVRKQKCVEQRRLEDNENVKKEQAKRKGLSLSRKRDADNKKFKLDQKIRKRAMRAINNAQDRLKNFREATKFNAIFICTCCHQRNFESNIQEFNTKLQD